MFAQTPGSAHLAPAQAGPVISSNYWTQALINNETSAELLQNF